MSNNNYIIQGGEEGKKRLSVLSEILEASTRSLIQSQIELEGKRFLDVGSGGGHVSLMASDLLPITYYLLPITYHLSTIFALNNAVPSLRLVCRGKSGLQWAPHPVKSGGFMPETA
jgi:hypothetical protein